MDKKHPNVRHPRELIPARAKVTRFNDRLLDFLASHVLASKTLFYACLILPLMVLPLPTAAKVTAAVFTSNWLQSWGLPAIQRNQVTGAIEQSAKADADHEAQTHIATVVDQILEAVTKTAEAV